MLRSFKDGNESLAIRLDSGTSQKQKSHEGYRGFQDMAPMVWRRDVTSHST
jgi:hypothetical protein